MILHQGVRSRRDRLLAEGIGHQPIGAGDQFPGEVAVTPRGHLPRGGREHVGIDHDRNRWRAGQRSLEAAVEQRRARGGVPVHRRGGRYADIAPARERNGVFDDVVDDAGSDRDRGGTGAESLGQPARMVHQGLQPRRLVEQKQLGGRASRREGRKHALARGLIGIAVGDDHDRLVGRVAARDRDDAGQRAGRDRHLARHLRVPHRIREDSLVVGHLSLRRSVLGWRSNV